MAGQDLTAQRSRLMRGGKRGATVVSDVEEIENHYFTYDVNGNVDTLTKEKVKSDGTIWRKIITFVYDPVTGFMTSKTETLQLIN